MSPSTNHQPKPTILYHLIEEFGTGSIVNSHKAVLGGGFKSGKNLTSKMDQNMTSSRNRDQIRDV